MDLRYPKKIRPDKPTGRRPRRAAVLACATILATVGMVAAGKAPSAWACTSVSHCYAMGQSNGGDNYGESATININCLYINNDSDNFVTNELWDQSGDAKYWEETGAMSGSLGSNSQGKYWSRELFWADERPNGGSFHWHPVAATGDESWAVEIAYVGNNTWDVYSGGAWYTSTAQPMFSDGASTNAGSEYTVNSGQAGLRDVGSVSAVEWENSAGNWIPVGGSMSSDGELGTDAWINPVYYPDSSTVTWSGPC
jgi:hypothetical protein